MSASPIQFDRRRIPLGFRMLGVLLGTALIVSVLVTLEVGGRAHHERDAAARTRLESASIELATRLAPHLESGDDLRLALVATAAADVSGGRVLVVDRAGLVRFDSGVAAGGKTVPLLASSGANFRTLEGGASESIQPCRLGNRLLGEVRVRGVNPAPAGFAWGLFGLVFLTSLSLVSLAVALSHQWLVSVREAADVARELARGETQARCRTDAPGVVGDLQRAMIEVGDVMRTGVTGVRESVVALGLELVDQIERRDQTPPGHGLRTARYAAMLAESLALLEEDRRELDLAARLHDLGKVAVRPNLLAKAGVLSAPERESLRQHADRGAGFLSGVPSLQRVALMVRHHHEKYGGTGYPDGLRGERIPLGARIIAIADAYDVLTSRGIDGEPLVWSAALDRLREDRGDHFDPWLFDLFEGLVRRSPCPEEPARAVVLASVGVAGYQAGEGTALQRELEASQAEDDDLFDATGSELELLREEREGEAP